MNVMIVGSGGMIGQGVLQSCLSAKDITGIYLLVRRKPENIDDPRVHIIQHDDLFSFNAADLPSADIKACFFVAGISALGVSEQDYRRITYDLTVHIAEQLQKHSPAVNFVYMSGVGADSSGKSSQMWARVRGEVENRLQQLLPGQVAIFRPSLILASPGVKSRTQLYRALYSVLNPVMFVIGALTGARFLSTSDIGHAMLNIARYGVEQAIMTKKEILNYADKTSTDII